MKKEWEIRRLLGNDYHLGKTYKEDGNISWVLFRRYDNFNIYISEKNKPIMTSENNTEKELYKFAKKHHQIDIESFYYKICLLVSYLMLGLVIVNIFVNSVFIRGIFWGVETFLIISEILIFIISNRNHKIKQEKMKEEINIYKDFIKGDNK